MRKVVVSIKETSRDCWRLSFDGRIRGDSRGYSKEKAQQEAVAYVTKANKWPCREEDYVIVAST